MICTAFVATATQIPVGNDKHSVTISGTVDPGIALSWSIKNVDVSSKQQTLLSLDSVELGFLTTGNIKVLCKLEPDGVGMIYSAEKNLYINPKVWEVKDFKVTIDNVLPGGYILYIYAFEDGNLRATYTQEGVIVD